MEIDEVINAIYSGDADDACERLIAYLQYADAEWLEIDIDRIPVAAQKARNAQSRTKS